MSRGLPSLDALLAAPGRANVWAADLADYVGSLPFAWLAGGSALCVVCLFAFHRTGRLVQGEDSFILGFIRFWLGRLPFLMLFFGLLFLVLLVGSGAFAQIRLIGYEVGISRWFSGFFGAVLPPLGVGVVVGVVVGRIVSLLIARSIEPAVMRLVHSTTKRQGRDVGFTDARTLSGSLPRVPDFNPARFFGKAKKANAVFLGLDEAGKPVWVDRAIWCKSNVQIMGPPGSGKGVAAAVALSQSLRHFDDGVVVFDPKNDEWAPSVFCDACESAGVPFTFVDLRSGRGPQINPIAGVDGAQLQELLIAAFSLGRKGEAADFYRQSDRRAARILASGVRAGDSLPALADRAAEELGEDLAKQATGFLGQLEELAEISSIQTGAGVDLASVLESGGCVYLVGSMRDEAVIMLQKLLFVRLVQLVESRPRGGRHVTAFLDEFKYLLSKPAVDALGVVRDKGMNILLAHQSLGDFAMCGQDLTPKAVETTVVDTTPLKWIYRTKDHATALWASAQTGTILADREMRDVMTNEAGSETASTERRLVQEDRALIDTNTIQHLPDGCAVCIGDGQAKLAFAQPLRVKKRDMVMCEAPAVSRVDVGASLLSDVGDLGDGAEEGSVGDEKREKRDVGDDLL